MLTVTAQSRELVTLNDLVIVGSGNTSSTLILEPAAEIAGDNLPTTLVSYNVPSTFVSATTLSFQAFFNGYAISRPVSIPVLQINFSSQPAAITTQDLVIISASSTFQITSSNFNFIINATNGASSTLPLGPNFVISSTVGQLAAFNIPISFDGSISFTVNLYDGSKLINNSPFTVRIMNFKLASNPSSAFSGLSLAVTASSNVTQVVDSVVFVSDSGMAISTPVTASVYTTSLFLTNFIVPPGFANETFQINAFSECGARLNESPLVIPIRNFVFYTYPVAFAQIGAPLIISAASTLGVSVTQIVITGSNDASTVIPVSVVVSNISTFLTSIVLPTTFFGSDSLDIEAYSASEVVSKFTLPVAIVNISLQPLLMAYTSVISISGFSNVAFPIDRILFEADNGVTGSLGFNFVLATTSLPIVNVIFGTAWANSKSINVTAIRQNVAGNIPPATFFLSQASITASPNFAQVGSTLVLSGVSETPVTFDALRITDRFGLTINLPLNPSVQLNSEGQILRTFTIPASYAGNTLYIDGFGGGVLLTPNSLVVAPNSVPDQLFLSISPSKFLAGTVLNISGAVSGVSTVDTVTVSDPNGNLLTSIPIVPNALIENGTLVISTFTVPQTYPNFSVLNIQAHLNQVPLLLAPFPVPLSTFSLDFEPLVVGPGQSLFVSGTVTEGATATVNVVVLSAEALNSTLSRSNVSNTAPPSLTQILEPPIIVTSNSLLATFLITSAFQGYTNLLVNASYNGVSLLPQSADISLSPSEGRFIAIAEPSSVAVESSFNLSGQVLQGPNVIVTSFTVSAADGSNITSVALPAPGTIVSTGNFTFLDSFYVGSRYANTNELLIQVYSGVFALLEDPLVVALLSNTPSIVLTTVPETATINQLLTIYGFSQQGMNLSALRISGGAVSTVLPVQVFTGMIVQ